MLGFLREKGGITSGREFTMLSIKEYSMSVKLKQKWTAMFLVPTSQNQGKRLLDNM